VIKTPLALSLLVLSGCAILVDPQHKFYDHMTSILDTETFKHAQKDHTEEFSKFLKSRTSFTQTGQTYEKTTKEDIKIMDMFEARYKRYSEIGHITVKGRTRIENYEILLLFLRMKASEIGANAVINFKKQTTRPGEPSNLKKVSGIAIRILSNEQ